jgi:hypothetical protein
MGILKQAMIDSLEQEVLTQYYEGLGKEKVLDMTMREFLDITQHRDVTVGSETVIRRAREESAQEVLAEFKDMAEGTE